MRVLRLAIGLWAIIEAYKEQTFVLGIMGGLLIVMAILNIGCCSVNGSCNAPINTKRNQKSGEIKYEEIT